MNRLVEKLETLLMKKDIDAFLIGLDNLDNINELVSDGSNLLHGAVTYDVRAVKSLLDRDIDVNIQNEDGKTALHYMAECDVDEIYDLAELALKKGADPNLVDKHGNNALWTAVFESGKVINLNYELVKLYLKYGADPNNINSVGKAPIHIVKRRENAELQDIFVDYL